MPSGADVEAQILVERHRRFHRAFSAALEKLRRQNAADLQAAETEYASAKKRYDKARRMKTSLRWSRLSSPYSTYATLFGIAVMVFLIIVLAMDALDSVAWTRALIIICSVLLVMLCSLCVFMDNKARLARDAATEIMHADIRASRGVRI